MLIDWSKLIKPPNALATTTTLYNSTSINVTAWQGSYSNFLRYCVGGMAAWDNRLRADLVVSFHPDFVSQPKSKSSRLSSSSSASSSSSSQQQQQQSPLANWSDDLRTLLVQQRTTPCLFTFATSEEKQRGAQALATSFQANFMCIKPNEYSSLLLRQVANKPNHVFATNGFSVFVRGSNAGATTMSNNINNNNSVIDPVTRYLKLGTAAAPSTPNEYLLSK